VGIALVMHGAYRTYVLISSSSTLEHKTYILIAGVSPYRLVPEVLLKVATGVAMLFRSKFSMLFVLAWMASIAFISLGVPVLMHYPIQSWIAVLEPATALLLLVFLLGRKVIR
jgi:hypothetical protein